MVPNPNRARTTLTVTREDGLKNFTVQYRNIYGNESLAKEISIEKKSTVPENCQASFPGPTTSEKKVRFFASAENQGETLFYQLTGDIEQEMPWISFNEQIETEIFLSEDAGEKNVIVSIRDKAGNACTDIPLTITLDPDNHISTDIRIKDNALYTDTTEVTVVFRHDHLVTDEVEMFISGQVAYNEETYRTWIPFEEEKVIQLLPHEGQRFITVKYRNNRDEVTKLFETRVHLKPTLFIQGDEAPYTIVASNMEELDYLSINGCVEDITRQSYQESGYPCSAEPGAIIAVTYVLSDGVSITREKTIASE